MATFDVTINGTKRRVRVIDIHGKSSSDPQSYDRRVYDAKVLHDSLDAFYPHDNIILLGDFNDQVYGSITSAATSSYKIFVDDIDNFKAITYDLNVSGASTFPNSHSFIDNIIISNELVNAYVTNSTVVEDPRSYINNYSYTTSDHLPVWSRFLMSSKADQSLIFDALPSKTYGDPNFVLSATASSGLDVSYTSSDPSVVAINGNVATILKGGSATITASQPGSEDFNTATSVDQPAIINKADQLISFTTIDDKTVGDASFALTASSTSGLAIEYTTTSGKITITTDQVALTEAGRVTITATQLGNENYNAAVSLDQSFCVNPVKPVITVTGVTSISPMLTSSAPSGNQWYFNGNEIANAVGSSLTVTTRGEYQVQVHTDNCFSEFSEEANVIITAIEESADQSISIYPNPVEGYLFIRGIEIAQLVLSDVTGRTHIPSFEKYNESYRIDMREFSTGLYALRVNDGQTTHALKILKK